MASDLKISSSERNSSKSAKVIGNQKGKNKKKRKNNGKNNEEKKAQLLKQWEMMDDEEDDGSHDNIVNSTIQQDNPEIQSKSVTSGLGDLKWKISEHIIETPKSFLDKQEEEKLGISPDKNGKNSTKSASKKSITLKVPKETIK